MTLKAQSNSKLGHRNISCDAEKHDYIVSIFRNGKYFKANFDTLDEAINVRDRALEFYEKKHF